MCNVLTNTKQILHVHVILKVSVFKFTYFCFCKPKLIFEEATFNT